MELVVVSGAPATGKSTVAAALGAELSWPVLSLDVLKEALADVLGLGDEAWSDLLGGAAEEVLFRLSGAFPSVVVEGWWRGARRDRAVAAFAGGLEVFCHCDPELVVTRMRARHGAGRHPIHRDVINPAIVESTGTRSAQVTPLGLGAGLVRVDTGRSGAVGRAVAEAVAELRRLS